MSNSETKRAQTVSLPTTTSNKKSNSVRYILGALVTTGVAVAYSFSSRNIRTVSKINSLDIQSDSLSTQFLKPIQFDPLGETGLAKLQRNLNHYGFCMPQITRDQWQKSIEKKSNICRAIKGKIFFEAGAYNKNESILFEADREQIVAALMYLYESSPFEQCKIEHVVFGRPGFNIQLSRNLGYSSAQYNPRTKTIIIEKNCSEQPIAVVAGVLSHELIHATHAQRKTKIESTEACDLEKIIDRSINRIKYFKNLIEDKPKKISIQSVKNFSHLLELIKQLPFSYQSANDLYHLLNLIQQLQFSHPLITVFYAHPNLNEMSQADHFKIGVAEYSKKPINNRYHMFRTYPNEQNLNDCRTKKLAANLLDTLLAMVNHVSKTYKSDEYAYEIEAYFFQILNHPELLELLMPEMITHYKTRVVEKMSECMDSYRSPFKMR